MIISTDGLIISEVDLFSLKIKEPKLSINPLESGHQSTLHHYPGLNPHGEKLI
jgi:hypothetical protein